MDTNPQWALKWPSSSPPYEGASPLFMSASGKIGPTRLRVGPPEEASREWESVHFSGIKFGGAKGLEGWKSAQKL
jgi:hypothetical protein